MAISTIGATPTITPVTINGTQVVSMTAPSTINKVTVAIDRGGFTDSTHAYRIDLTLADGTYVGGGAGVGGDQIVSILQTGINALLPTSAVDRQLTITLTSNLLVSTNLSVSGKQISVVSPLFPGHHSVAFDAAATIDGFGVTSLTTGSFTVGSGGNRAALLGLMVYASATSITGSLGGTSGTLLANVTSAAGSGAGFTQLIQVIAPPSGSQTATASWTTSGSASLGVITATGVDQTTPFNNTNSNAGAFEASISLAITSTSGDLTSTCMVSGNADAAQTTNQTLKNADFASMDIGPGTGTTTHTWSDATTSNLSMIGANFKQAPTDNQEWLSTNARMFGQHLPVVSNIAY